MVECMLKSVPTFTQNAIICIVRAEGMSEYMRGDVRQWAIRMKLLVLLHSPTYLVLDVKCDIRIAVLVQYKEAAALLLYGYSIKKFNSLESNFLIGRS